MDVGTGTLAMEMEARLDFIKVLRAFMPLPYDCPYLKKIERGSLTSRNMVPIMLSSSDQTSSRTHSSRLWAIWLETAVKVEI